MGADPWLPLRLELATLKATTTIDDAIEMHEHKTALIRARDDAPDGSAA